MDAFLLGATGLVGSSILQQLNKDEDTKSVKTISRRNPQESSTKITSLVETDSSKWPDIIRQQRFSHFISAFGTTRAFAGSADKFVEIDYGTNYDAARAAHDAGAHTLVLISTVGANAKSPFLYLKTKGRLEEDIIALKFPRTVIIRPGVLLGERDPQRARGWAHDTFVGLASYLHGLRFTFGMNPVYGHEVARVAAALAKKTPADSTGPTVEIIGPTDVVALAKSLN